MRLELGPRRGTYIDISEATSGRTPLGAEELAHFENFDLIYRSLCALLFNYVPMSGHPGGSISSGRFVAGAAVRRHGLRPRAIPDRDDADIISYAAGHKALGLYAMWALRNEVARIGAPELLPDGRALPAAPRGPARLPPQPGHRHAALQAVQRQAARRAPDAGHAVRPALHRRLGRRRGHLARPGLRRRATTTARTRRGCTSSRARAA